MVVATENPTWVQFVAGWEAEEEAEEAAAPLGVGDVAGGPSWMRSMAVVKVEEEPLFRVEEVAAGVASWT